MFKTCCGYKKGYKNKYIIFIKELRVLQLKHYLRISYITHIFLGLFFVQSVRFLFYNVVQHVSTSVYKINMFKQSNIILGYCRY